MANSLTLRIDPPLPCGVRAPDAPERRCGRPATVAQADARPDGTYAILPICRDCVAMLARVYGVADRDRGAA